MDQQKQIEGVAKEIHEIISHNLVVTFTGEILGFNEEGIARELIDDGYSKEKHGKWLFIKEPNAVDTCGNPVYHAQCSECGFKWTDLYAVRKYFKGCPRCTTKMECPSVFEVWKDCELGQTYKVHTFYTKPDADEWVNQNKRYYPGWHLRVVEVKE